MPVTCLNFLKILKKKNCSLNLIRKMMIRMRIWKMIRRTWMKSSLNYFLILKKVNNFCSQKTGKELNNSCFRKILKDLNNYFCFQKILKALNSFCSQQILKEMSSFCFRKTSLFLKAGYSQQEFFPFLKDCKTPVMHRCHPDFRLSFQSPLTSMVLQS